MIDNIETSVPISKQHYILADNSSWNGVAIFRITFGFNVRQMADFGLTKNETTGI